MRSASSLKKDENLLTFVTPFSKKCARISSGTSLRPSVNLKSELPNLNDSARVRGPITGATAIAAKVPQLTRVRLFKVKICVHCQCQKFQVPFQKFAKTSQNSSSASTPNPKKGFTTTSYPSCNESSINKCKKNAKIKVTPGFDKFRSNKE